MESTASSLNPFAQSYVPLALRELPNKEVDNQTSPNAQTAIDDQKLKGQKVDSPHGLLSENPHEMDCKLMDEESEIDIAYLQMTFPGISDQSLLDVYNVNRGDLEASVDMLTHLESVDDFRDLSGAQVPEEHGPAGECSSVKVLSVTRESSTSSGSSSDLSVPT